MSTSFHKIYLISSRVWRVLDLCCDYSCKNRTLRQAAFALQKSGEAALLRIPDCIIPYMKKKRALLITVNLIVIPLMATQPLFFAHNYTFILFNNRLWPTSWAVVTDGLQSSS